MTTTIQLKSWTPQGGKFTRYYVTDTNTGEQIGYIQTHFAKQGYGDGYYANHRATKGDFGVETVSRIELNGDTDTLQAVVDLAKSLHPHVAELGRPVDSPGVESQIDLVLEKMSVNQQVSPMLSKTARSKKLAEIQNRKYEVA